FPSSVPLYFVSRLAAEHVTVVLTGEGADELFLGYNRYRVTAWNERIGAAYAALLPAGLRRAVAGAVPRLPAGTRRYVVRTFLDHELVEYVAALPDHLKVRGLRTKAILREALKDLVPRPILTRRKMGFPVPVGRWLRGPFQPVAREYLLGPRALRRGLFDPSFVERLVAEHRAGAADHGDRLWLLLNLEIWQRIFVDGEDSATITLPDRRPAVAVGWSALGLATGIGAQGGGPAPRGERRFPA